MKKILYIEESTRYYLKANTTIIYTIEEQLASYTPKSIEKYIKYEKSKYNDHKWEPAVIDSDGFLCLRNERESFRIKVKTSFGYSIEKLLKKFKSLVKDNLSYETSKVDQLCNWNQTANINFNTKRLADIDEAELPKNEDYTSTHLYRDICISHIRTLLNEMTPLERFIGNIKIRWNNYRLARMLKSFNAKYN